MSIVGEVSWTDVAQVGVGFFGLGLVFWQLYKLLARPRETRMPCFTGSTLRLGNCS